MTVLEMLTGEYPYRECEREWDIYLKVSHGIKPAVLAALDGPKDKSARDFVLNCLKFDPKERYESDLSLSRDIYIQSVR